jgi:nicotinate-nucleotide adenylyltransferase
VSYVLATQDLQQVLVVPTFAQVSPLGKPLTPFAHRVEMCNRAFRDLRRVEVSDIEAQLGETSRTLFTLRALQSRHPEWAMRLIVGADILEERDRWFGWDEVVRLAPPIVLGRQGVDHPEAPFALLPAVASSRRPRGTFARASAGARTSPPWCPARPSPTRALTVCTRGPPDPAGPGAA